MIDLPELIKDPETILGHLFMEPVEFSDQGQHYIKAYEDDVFDISKLQQLHRLYPEGDIVLTFSPDATDALYDVYELFLTTEYLRPFLGPELRLNDYVYIKKEGIIHWYAHRNAEVRLNQKVGRLHMPLELFTEYLRTAYHDLDSNMARVLVRPFCYVNNMDAIAFETELERQFEELRSQGIYELSSEREGHGDSSGRESWKFFDHLGVFNFRLVVEALDQNNFNVTRIDN